MGGFWLELREVGSGESGYLLVGIAGGGRERILVLSVGELWAVGVMEYGCFLVGILSGVRTRIRVLFSRN